MPKKKKRLIPAYAGSTSSSYWASWLAQAHPRLRGEHWPAPPKWLSGMGSSPLTRGARVLHRRRPGTPGLIPAYAGSTMKSPPCWAWLGAHPRLRGEHSGEEQVSVLDQGSSPLTRGAQLRRPLKIRQRRLIPAYAGSTPSF